MYDFRLISSGCLTGLLAVVATAAPSRAQADARPAGGPVVAASPRLYDVEAYDVDGAKLLPTEDVETAVYPFLGPGMTRDDIEHARAALEKTYRDRGYSTVVVQLPAQTVADNIVRLHVVEATVGRLRVTGARYFSPEAIKTEAAAFQEGQAPNINQAQLEMAELNRSADRRVNPVLRAGVVPGTVDVDLKVSDTLPLHASVDLTNDHNQFTTPLRTTATVHYDNLWQLQHSLSFTFATAPENISDSEIFAGSYLAPVPHSPFSILVSGYDSNSNVSTLGGTSVLGKGYSVGVRAIDQLPRVAGLTQSLSFGFDFKSFDENIAIKSTPGTKDVIQYWPLTAAYSVAHDGDKASTRASLSLTVGTRGIGSNTATFENKRFNARPEFVHANLDVTQTETLPRGFTASEHLVGQIADGPLVSSEEFSAGGLTSVRGYLQSEAVGDEGFTGTAEITSPSLVQKWTPGFDDIRLFSFVDGGALWVLSPLSGQTKSYTLVSAGVGLRIVLLRHIKAEVAIGEPLITVAATHANRPRATFSLKSDF